MKQKGLFELFFVLIMLLLFMPVATHKNLVTTPTVLAQVNSLALLTDFAIADALSDQAFVNCDTSGIGAKISPYLNHLFLEFNKVSGANCSYSNNPGVLSSGAYVGKIDIICESNTFLNKTKITKNLFYSKEISVTSNCDSETGVQQCTVKILDRYASNHPFVNKTNTSSC